MGKSIDGKKKRKGAEIPKLVSQKDFLATKNAPAIEDLVSPELVRAEIDALDQSESEEAQQILPIEIEEAIKINNQFNAEKKKNQKVVEATLAKRARETVGKKKREAIKPVSATRDPAEISERIRLARLEENQETPADREHQKLQKEEFESALFKFNAAKMVEQTPSSEAVTDESAPKTAEAVSENNSNEFISMFRTKHLDPRALEGNEALMHDMEHKAAVSQLKLTGLANELSEIQTLRELQQKGLDAAKNRLGDSAVSGKVELAAQEELANWAQKEESLNKEVMRETARLESITSDKEFYKQKAEDIRLRVAERVHTFVSPLEVQVSNLKDRETKAQMRIDRFKREREHLSGRLLTAKQTMEQAPADSVRLAWKNWMKKATKIFDDIDKKMAAAEKNQERCAQKRASLEFKINTWKELGESFEKRTPEVPKEKAPEVEQPVAAVETPVAPKTIERVETPQVEVTPEIKKFTEQWNKNRGSLPPLTNDIAKWIKQPEGRPMNRADIARGVSDQLIVRQRGIWTWPVFSWIASWRMNRILKRIVSEDL